MKLQTDIDEIDGIYHVQVGLSDARNALTPVELEAISKVGEPEVDCGGNFGSGEGAFTLDASTRRFPSQFPVKALFSTVDYDDAKIRALAFRTAIEARIAAARDTLLEADATGTGQWVTTV